MLKSAEAIIKKSGEVRPAAGRDFAIFLKLSNLIFKSKSHQIKRKTKPQKNK